MNLFARASHYLSRMPGGVSGSGGHDATFAAACTTVRFGLTEDEQLDLLSEFNARCSPPWSDSELRHKLNDARKHARHGELATSSFRGSTGPIVTSPRPHVATPAAKADARQPDNRPTLPHVTCPDFPGCDLPEPIEKGAVELLRTLYKPEECVRIAKGVIREDGREQPEDGGCSLPVREWLAKAAARGGDLASMWSSAGGAGVYVGINPVAPGGKRDEDITAYRFALIESDAIAPEDQWGRICGSRVPCAAVIDSAGKSIHAWVRVDARDRREFDERVAFLLAYFPWADPKNKNPSRLSRLPDAKRRGKRQRLLATGLGCSSWVEWTAEVQRQSLGPPRSFADLCALDTTSDPNCVIGFRDGKTLRYLCRGKSAWLLGPSGVGKSSLVAQFAVGWSIGSPVFGVTPARPLRSLIIQAENDDYDLAEMVQGVARSHGLTPEDPRWPCVAGNVMFRTETSSFGPAFCRKLADMLAADRPDVVWIDPLLSFAGIDVSKQDQVTPFLRGQLSPVIEASGAVAIGVHHTGKPKDAKATRDWTAIDWAYAGIGSSELVNWARAVMLLRPVEQKTYELKFAKRGSRAGATHPDGSPAWGSVWLQQATGRIHWEQVNPPEEPADEPSRPANERKGGAKASEDVKRGRPSKVEEIAALTALADFLNATPSDGEGLREIARRLEVWLASRSQDVNRSTCTRIIERLVAAQKLTKNPECKYVKGPNV